MISDLTKIDEGFMSQIIEIIWTLTVMCKAKWSTLYLIFQRQGMYCDITLLIYHYVWSDEVMWKKE